MWGPTVSSDELYHHGILKMKWGIRNGPPYPLNQSQKSKAEKTAETNKRKGLTDKQKSMLKKAAIATLVIGGVAATGIVIAKHPELLKKAKIGAQVVANNFANKTVNDILGAEKASFKINSENAIKCAKNINPSGSVTNCGSCSSATMLNSMGGNYQALPEVPEHMRLPGKKGYDPNKLIECFEGGKWSNKITNTDNSRRKATEVLEKALIEQGDGSKGIFYCEGRINGRPGHYFCWANIGGKIHVLEGQPASAQSTGIDYHKNLYDEVGKLFDLDYGEKGVYWARLDNCPVKPDRLKDIAIQRR